MGLRIGNRRYEHEETIRTRVERELGEGRRDQEQHAQIPQCGVVSLSRPKHCCWSTLLTNFQVLVARS
jgi:hypothetical protein